jgi:hypothetical protein
VLLAREFGWTIDGMRQLTPRELAVVLNELQRQVAIEQLNEQRNHWAFLAAVITNGFGAITSMFSKRKHKDVSPDDFMGKDEVVIKKDLPDHTAGMELVLEVLVNPEYGCIQNMDEIGAVGHRVVHGGEAFAESVVIDEQVKKVIRDCFDYFHQSHKFISLIPG